MERATAADSESPLTFAGLAEAQWFKYFITEEKHWLNRATESVRQAENRYPDLPQVHRIAGLMKYDAGRYEQAIEEYLRAIELDPTNGDAYRRIGEAYQHNNQPEKALAAFHRAIEADPKQYRNHRDLGTFYYDRGDYEEAVKHFGKAVELAQDEPFIRFSLAAAHINLGQFGPAEHEPRLSLRLRETPVALHALGFVLMYQGQDREAVTNITHALNLAPETYLWWMNLGTAYRRLHLKSESARAYRRGLDLAEVEMTNNPRNGLVRAHLAYLCAQTGDRQRAESEIAQSLQLSPNDADTRFIAAITYEVLGRRNDTLSVLASSPGSVLKDLSRWPDVADLHKDSRPERLEDALGITRTLSQALAASSCLFDEIRQEIDAGRPVCVRIGWQPNEAYGHFVVIRGYSMSSVGEQWVDITDPYYFDSTVPYDQFVYAYLDAGEWTDTYLVKHP
jgi:eukaryotic-like serine/threonine-protein kinase